MQEPKHMSHRASERARKSGSSARKCHTSGSAPEEGNEIVERAKDGMKLEDVNTSRVQVARLLFALYGGELSRPLAMVTIRQSVTATALQHTFQ